MNLKTLNRFVLTSMISICTANIAFAQSKTSDITHEVSSTGQSAYGELKGYVATKSSTGSKMDIDIAEIPQSVSVITNDMISIKNEASVQSLIAYDSSVSFPSGLMDLRTNYGKIRGLDLIYNSTFLDGLKQVPYGAAMPFVFPYALERIEILKGPSSVLYGDSGPGGLLNLQSKKANTTNSAEVGISYGSNQSKSVFTDINRKINENLFVRVTADYSKADAQLDESSTDSYFLNPTVKYLIDDNTSLDVSASFAKHSIDSLGLGYSGAPANLVYQNSVLKNFDALNTIAGGFLNKAALTKSAKELNDIYLKDNMFIGLADYELFEKKQTSITATLNKEINTNLNLTSSIRFNKISANTYFSQPDSAGMLTPTGPLFTADLSKFPMSFIESESEIKSIILDNNLQYNWGSKNIENSSIFGLDIQKSKGKKQRTKPVAYVYNLKNPNPHQKITRTNLLSTKENQDITQLGLYASNNMKINSKYVLSTSLRYDKINDKIENEISGSKNTQKDDNISGRVGLIYLMDNGMSPYVSYSTSFQTNFGTTKSGSAFKPSTGKQIETGIKYRPENINMFATLSIFDLSLEDAVEVDPNDTSFKIQDSEQNVKGIELNITASPLENLNLVFSLAKLHSEYKKAGYSFLKGKSVSRVPELTASLWTDYTFSKSKLGKIKIGAGIKYIGELSSYQGDNLNPAHVFPGNYGLEKFTAKSYTLADAMIATQLDKWNISLNIYNLFNKKATTGGYTDSVSLSPIQERTFKLTATYKF